jgi:hypothetical protein
MRFSRLWSIILLLTMFTSMAGCSKSNNSEKDIFQTEDKIKLVSRVDGEDITYYADGNWNKSFWYGINLGATTPGHFPGELSPTYDDYRRWFADMEELGVQVIRIYTILPPHFYQALVDHNESAGKKLWFIQGIWPPDEELVQEKNAYLPTITKKDDWDKIGNLTKSKMDDGSLLMATSDEGYLYLAIDKPAECLNWQEDKLIIGFDTQPGGNHSDSKLGVNFNQGIEFLWSCHSVIHIPACVANQ